MFKINFVFIGIAAAVTCILYIKSGTVTAIMGRGFDTVALEMSSSLLKILSPSILLYPIVYVGMSLLQACEKFKISALVPVAFNLMFLIGVIYCYIMKIPVNRGVYILSFVIMISILGMMALTYMPLNLGKRKPKVEKDTLHKTVIFEIIKLFMPYLIILSISQAVLYYERYLASLNSPGSVAALNYAFRLSQFPVWVFTAAVGMVIFPKMSRYSSKGNKEELNSTLLEAVKLIVIITLPVSIGMFILREPIISILFLRGAFDNESMNLTGSLLKGYSLGILGQSIIYICLKFYLSVKKVLRPFLIMLLTGLINLLYDIYFIQKMGISALGYGSAISAVLAAIMLFLGTGIKFKDKLWRNLILSGKVIAVNLPLLLIIKYTGSLWEDNIAQSIFLYKALYGFIVFILCLAVYIVLLASLKIINLRKFGRGNRDVKGSFNNTGLQ